MRPRLKQSLYAGARAAGLFRLSRLLTRRGLRIVCWHGTSLADEHRVFPACSFRPTTSSAGCSRSTATRLPLEEAVRGSRGDAPAGAVALTIDDGFHGTLRHAWPALPRHGFPATLYATTLPRPGAALPVVRLLVQWAFRESKEPVLDLSELGRGWWARCG
jgi:hypothetical protein